jgi:hypothetical protein
MKYIETYKLLKDKIDYYEPQITIPDIIEVRNFTFKSNNVHLLPDETDDILLGYDMKCETGIMHELLGIHDTNVKENLSFKYHVFSPVGTKKRKK